MPKKNPDFDIALSFAGEDRSYVEQVARYLTRMGLRVFYDKHEVITLWGKDLYTHLREIYAERARFTVIFISRAYKRKLWANHERASAQARAFRERREYILPARFDSTKIPGVLDTTGYVELNGVSPLQLAEMIKNKLGPIDRPLYFPPEPNVLWQHMKARTSQQQARVTDVAARLFNAMKLMTVRERHIFGYAVIDSCREKLPKNVHIELGYLARVVRAKRDEIIATFARLDCLGFTTRIRRPRKFDSHLGEGEQIEISYFSSAAVPLDYDTRVLSAVFSCFDTECVQCVNLAIKQLDWSSLSSYTANPSAHELRTPSRKPPAG